MGYSKQNFEAGQTLTAAALNKIEDGIVQIETDVSSKDYLTKTEASSTYQPKGEYITAATANANYQAKGDYVLREDLNNGNALSDAVKQDIAAAAIALLPIYNGEVSDV